MHLNVFRTFDLKRVMVFGCLWKQQLSMTFCPKVAAGEVEIQGGIYDLETGHVEFLGQSPAQATLVKSTSTLPPSLA